MIPTRMKDGDKEQGKLSIEVLNQIKPLVVSMKNISLH